MRIKKSYLFSYNRDLFTQIQFLLANDYSLRVIKLFLSADNYSL